MDIKEYQALKSKVEAAQRQHDRIEGAIEQKEQQLEDLLGCKSLKEANQQIAREEKEIAKIRKEFEDQLKAYEAKWEGK